MRDRLIKLLQKAEKKCNDTKQCENCVGFGKGAEFKECISVEQMCARYVQLKNYLDSLFRQNVALMSMKGGE